LATHKHAPAYFSEILHLSRSPLKCKTQTALAWVFPQRATEAGRVKTLRTYGLSEGMEDVKADRHRVVAQSASLV